MRTRSSSYSYPKVNTKEYKAYSNSANPVTSRTDKETINDSETSLMQDVVTPNYRRRILAGEIINNPMYKETVTEKYSGGSLDHQFLQYNSGNPSLLTGFTNLGKYEGWHYSHPNRYIPAAALDHQALRDKATVDAHNKAAQNDTELLAVAGEMKETVASLQSITKRVINIIWALKKWDMKRLAKEITPKELANRYMEARYAIRPLVYDVSGILKALNNTEQNRRITARGGVTETASVSDVVLLINNTYYQVYYRRNTEISVTCRAGVLSMVDNLSKLHIWGMDRIYTSAWELIPLSFVVDWFFNVGKLIDAWQPKSCMRALASWVVEECTTIQTCSVDHCVALWPSDRVHAKYMIYSAMCYKITEQTERVVNPSLPVLPSLDVKLDTLKLLDLGIILKNLWG